jgi:hypothetical protein
MAVWRIFFSVMSLLPLVMGANSLQVPLEGVDPKSWTFLGRETNGNEQK